MILQTTDEIIGALERGDLSKDFASLMREVLEACREHEGKGSVTLKLAIAAKDEMVTIKAKLDSVVPKKDRRSSNFFMTGDGRLSLRHPDQIDIDFDRGRQRDRVTDIG